MGLGKRLRIARDSIGYTLDQVAERRNIGRSSLSEFEHGKREPKFSQLSTLAALYKRPIEFFLSDEPFIENVMLWRDPPEDELTKQEAEAEFRQLCEQYHKLEICTGETARINLPEPVVTDARKFSYGQATAFAFDIRKEWGLGEIPAASLKQTAEEEYNIKIFYLDFQGSAISTVSEKYGPAILMNRGSKLWRRNFDLAHELFHIITWRVFRRAPVKSTTPSSREETLANIFASSLLMPTERLQARVDLRKNSPDRVRLVKLESVAREFGVSLDALIWRMKQLYNWSETQTKEYCAKAKSLRQRFYQQRSNDVPNRLPARYEELAQRALYEGNISLLQFAKYMDLTYKQAEEYLKDDQELTDEEISVPFT